VPTTHPPHRFTSAAPHAIIGASQPPASGRPSASGTRSLAVGGSSSCAASSRRSLRCGLHTRTERCLCQERLPVSAGIGLCMETTCQRRSPGPGSSKRRRPRMRSTRSRRSRGCRRRATRSSARCRCRICSWSRAWTVVLVSYPGANTFSMGSLTTSAAPRRRLGGGGGATGAAAVAVGTVVRLRARPIRHKGPFAYPRPCMRPPPGVQHARRKEGGNTVCAQGGEAFSSAWS
jgi:hypothetical protein